MKTGISTLRAIEGVTYKQTLPLLMTQRTRVMMTMRRRRKRTTRRRRTRRERRTRSIAHNLAGSQRRGCMKGHRSCNCQTSYLCDVSIILSKLKQSDLTAISISCPIANDYNAIFKATSPIKRRLCWDCCCGHAQPVCRLTS